MSVESGLKNTKRWITVGAASAFCFALLLGLGDAAAQDGDRVKFKKVTKIDFTEGLIEGDLMRPEGSYVVSRKASQFSKLIRVRQNFVRELVFSYSEL
ncbi:MAG: hypothetical protein AAF658_18970 [Myxococcota bacterium]